MRGVAAGTVLAEWLAATVGHERINLVGLLHVRAREQLLAVRDLANVQRVAQQSIQMTSAEGPSPAVAYPLADARGTSSVERRST